jgi:hypothetical protein
MASNKKMKTVTSAADAVPVAKALDLEEEEATARDVALVKDYTETVCETETLNDRRPLCNRI